MRVSARADYALRAAVELAAAVERGSGPVTREAIASAQKVPLKFLESVLLELKHVGIVRSHRGAAGGYSLARDAAQITIADVLRAVDGPMANVRGERPELVEYPGPAAPLREVWIAVRASLRGLLEATTIADVVADRLPEHLLELTREPEAWISLGRVRGPADAGLRVIAEARPAPTAGGPSARASRTAARRPRSRSRG
ncbi:MAG TPA: Rrf2 family transcriptional regulator [Candidatus Limnocylindrales bacterium]|nr:Rrf2 family transcriptional regulator [Candidatus Limnocylindrales bacterium]